MFFKRWIAASLLSLIFGCQELAERVKPDRVSAGVTARKISGSHQGFHVKAMMPLWEVRAKKQVTKNLDAYARGQWNQGTLRAEHPLLAGQGSGEFASGAVGLDYFPWHSRHFGFEIGEELYYANYQMKGGLGPITQRENDSFLGVGTNLGVLGELPLKKLGLEHGTITWGLGYNLTDTQARRSRVSLDGWYWSLGVQVNLGK